MPFYTKEFALKGLRHFQTEPTASLKKRTFSFESIEGKWINNKFHIS
jgi:hypothetical protein